ncbi:MAG TPA: DUF2158 domain-containing protein [Vicinamibacterales bacterium]|nr:DUF2158 domain-containing protein [Vicinamibacterales bacterium]
MDQKFANGSTVRLKSGGPVMTVVGYDVWESYETEKKYKCRWFGPKNQLAEHNFTEAELELTAPPAKGVMFESM